MTPFADLPAMLCEYQQRFDAAVRTDPTVAKAISLIPNAGLTELDALRVCIVHLVEQRNDLQDQLMHANAIMPRRIKMHDGRIYRWDAPDEFVPIND